MQFEKCHSSVLRSLSLLPDHVKEIGALRALRLLRTVDTADQFGRTRHGGEPNAAAVADEAREPAPPCFRKGVRVAALVSLVAGGEAAAVPTLAAPSLDLLAALW